MLHVRNSIWQSVDEQDTPVTCGFSKLTCKFISKFIYIYELYILLYIIHI